MMNIRQRTENLNELSRIYSLGMHQYINAAICSENKLFTEFFERRAYERMHFVHEVQFAIYKNEGKRTKDNLDEMLVAWQDMCAFHNLKETFFVTNDMNWIDKKAVYKVRELLTGNLSEVTTSLIMGHMFIIEAGFIALDGLLGSMDL